MFATYPQFLQAFHKTEVWRDSYISTYSLYLWVREPVHWTYIYVYKKSKKREDGSACYLPKYTVNFYGHRSGGQETVTHRFWMKMSWEGFNSSPNLEVTFYCFRVCFVKFIIGSLETSQWNEVFFKKLTKKK